MNATAPLRRLAAAAILAGAVAGSAPLAGPVAPAQAHAHASVVVKAKHGKRGHRSLKVFPTGRKVG